MVSTSRRKFFGVAGAAVAGTAIAGTAVQLTGKSSAATVNLGLATGRAAPLGGPSAPAYTTLEPFRDPLRIPPVLRPSGDGITEVRLVSAQIRLHSQLPATPMWTYEGHYPGPTIEVWRNQKIRIAWQNQLEGTTPVRAVYTPSVGAFPGLANASNPGRDDQPLRPEIAGLTPWITTHLHGGHQHAFADGLPDCGVTPGYAQLAEYGNDGAPAHLFYHDHAMPVTAINCMAGLMGHYIITDPSEDQLGLPRGQYDIPLALSDVNFDTDAQGRLDGHLLQKRVQLSPSVPGQLPLAFHFLGPYNMVNGVVFPHLEVEATAYRFRLLNSALGKFYSLVVVDEATGNPVNGVMKVIGTDLGLLDRPKTIDQSLSLGPAERADIVIDFSAFPGKRLRLVNTVAGVPAGVPVPAAVVPFPEVMQFRVAAQPRTPYALPQKLSPDFQKITAADIPADATERFVLLTLSKMLMPELLELQEVPADTPAGDGIVRITPPGGSERAFQVVASRYEDTTTFFSAAGSFQKWTFVSAAPPGVPIVHPMHIHMMDFQILSRNAADASGYDPATQQTSTPITAQGPLPIAPEESGTKDTVSVSFNTMVTVVGRLASQTGKFMYHCHILNHEDDGMMRPHTIMPPSVLTVQNLEMASMPGTPMP